MDETAIKMLNLMFRDGESVCLSDTQFSNHSVPISMAISDKVTLVSPNSNIPIRKVDTDNVIFAAINPIQGFRLDANVTSFRNFLLEIDIGSIPEQIQYINQLSIPYSAIVFSGNKSAHVLLSLTSDIPNEQTYKKLYQWILNIGTLFDQACKNSSRSIRLPGVIRPETGKKQELLEFKGPISIEELANWLKKYPESKPKEYIKRERSKDYDPDFNSLPNWARKLFKNGLDPIKGRNVQIYAISYEFALQNFDEDSTIDYILQYFPPEKDFTEREILASIASAFRHVRDKI